MAIKPMMFDKEYAFTQLYDMKKQGYCSISAMPTWLRNEYRDLTLDKAVEVVNEWIDSYKIKHEHLVVLKTKTQTYILTETTYNRIMTNFKQTLARRHL